MQKTTRRESRETAFSLLFEWSFKEEPLQEIVETANEAGNAKADGFAHELAEKAIENREEIDGLIEKYSQGRRLSRISKTALAVLRLCFCEMTQFKDIPAGASINEGVELLKKYGTEEEAAYLNGILGSFDRDRKRGGTEPQPTKTKELYHINTHEQHNAHNTTIEQKPEIPQDDADEVELLDDITVEVD